MADKLKPYHLWWYLALPALILISSLAVAQEPPPGKRAKGLGAFSALTGGMSFGATSVPIVSYTGSLSPAEGSAAINQHRLHIAVPLKKVLETVYSMSISASTLHFAESPILLGSGTVVPKDLYKIDLGGQYSQQLENGRSLTARVAVGSSSNKPMSGMRDSTFSVTGAYGFPGGETSHWMLTVFVSNNNSIANYIPIPGFVYFWRSEKLIGMLGLPFASIHWMPANPWKLSLSAFGPSITSEVSYGQRNELQKFAGLSWTQQSFLRHDRIRAEDRVYISEVRAFLGLKNPISKELAIEIQGGQAFNREVSEGRSFFKKDQGRTTLKDSAYIQFNANYIF